MDHLKTGKILAKVSGWFLLILPILEFILALILFASVEYGNVLFKMAPAYFLFVLILRVIFAFVILWMSRKNAKLTHKSGVMFLVIGVLVALISFAQISMIVGILLILAGIFIIMHFSKTEPESTFAASASFAQIGYQPTTDANPFYNNALQQAVNQFQTGKKSPAYQSFKTLETDNPTDLNLLLWLAYSAPDLEIAYSYIKRAASLNPNSPSVAQAWLWLKKQTGLA